ncbi:sugar nucleotide-binding protein, partial [Acinetobacter baumannii]
AWSESDLTNPINLYGNTKRLGEIALEQSGCAFINFRTCWVYGSHGNNFIKTMLKLASTREELSIIHDQIGAPTGAALI